jgi:hypothetical protein
MYQEEELTKDARFLGRVTTLGDDRFIITVPKEDNPSIEHLKGKRVFVIARDANEPIEDKQESDNRNQESYVEKKLIDKLPKEVGNNLGKTRPRSKK